MATQLRSTPSRPTKNRWTRQAGRTCANTLESISRVSPLQRKLTMAVSVSVTRRVQAYGAAKTVISGTRAGWLAVSRRVHRIALLRDPAARPAAVRETKRALPCARRRNVPSRCPAIARVSLCRMTRLGLVDGARRRGCFVQRGSLYLSSRVVLRAPVWGANVTVKARVSAC